MKSLIKIMNRKYYQKMFITNICDFFYFDGVEWGRFMGKKLLQEVTKNY